MPGSTWHLRNSAAVPLGWQVQWQSHTAFLWKTGP